MNVLVVGARSTTSLGGAVVRELDMVDCRSVTAGISGEEWEMDLYNSPLSTIRSVLRAVRPHHVVCTAGINMPESVGHDPRDWYRWHFEANAIGPLRLLHEFATWITEDLNVVSGESMRHFVAISSNSAVIPRTQSAAYCASKAALSQGLRVKAREAQGGDHGYIVYGYEPGWLADTPMSDNIEKHLATMAVPANQMHRMRGKALGAGVSTQALAQQIVAGLWVPGAALNGATIRYDGGEL